MIPKLRARVTVASDAKGITFRVGNSFLEITGHECCRWFNTITPFISGKSSVDEAKSRLTGQEYDLFMRLVGALTRADMLYDAAADDRDLLSDTMLQQHSGIIARIESYNPRPIKTFARVVAFRTAIVGTPRYVLPILDACVEAGLTPQVVCVRGEKPDDMSLVVDSPQMRLLLERGQTICTEAESLFCSGQGIPASFDVCFLAGTDRDDDILWSTLAESGSAPVPRMFRLANYGEYAVAAALLPLAGMGCPACIAQFYRKCIQVGTQRSQPEDDLGIQIGARLLIQQMLDREASGPSSVGRSELLEVNSRTCEITRRPLFANPDCPNCSTKPTVSVSDSLKDSLSAEIPDARQLCRTAEKFYVDARTGLIAELVEKELLQFPYHQSAATLRISSKAGDQRVFTDSGKDIYAARMAVLARALECYLSEQIAALGRMAMRPALTIGCRRGPQLTVGASAAGVVGSGQARDEVLSNCVLKTVALHAHSTGSRWVDVSAWYHDHASDDVLVGYFTDLKLISAIRVERNVSTTLTDIDVVRFAYEGAVISVVAGLQSEAVWNVGLRDIWMEVTGRSCFGILWKRSRAIRYRAAEAKAMALPALHNVVETLGLEMQIRLFESPVISGLAPIRFAHSCLS